MKKIRKNIENEEENIHNIEEKRMYLLKSRYDLEESVEKNQFYLGNSHSSYERYKFEFQITEDQKRIQSLIATEKKFKEELKKHAELLFDNEEKVFFLKHHLKIFYEKYFDYQARRKCSKMVCVWRSKQNFRHSRFLL